MQNLSTMLFGGCRDQPLVLPESRSQQNWTTLDSEDCLCDSGSSLSKPTLAPRPRHRSGKPSQRFQLAALAAERKSQWPH